MMKGRDRDKKQSDKRIVKENGVKQEEREPLSLECVFVCVMCRF